MDTIMDIGVLRRDGRTDPFFDGTAAERLMIRRCEPCGLWYAPDASTCPACGTEDLTWAEASGQATLVTWTITHARPAPDGTAPEPAILALVDLAEGPWLHARLTDIPHEALTENLPLKARYEHPAEGESYLLFAPTTPAT